eukprot:m.57312 g.57312  ORF g.57312 m.57312 type:complete len:856 (+) comp11222_c0_seq1:39-2606(+)
MSGNGEKKVVEEGRGDVRVKREEEASKYDGDGKRHHGNDDDLHHRKKHRESRRRDGQRDIGRDEEGDRSREKDRGRDRGRDRRDRDKDDRRRRHREDDSERRTRHRDEDRNRRHGRRDRSTDRTTKSERRDRDKDRSRSRERGGDSERRSRDKDHADGKSRHSKRHSSRSPSPSESKEAQKVEKKRVPLSLEEMLIKKKQQEEESMKPKFLSKKEREAAALRRIEEQRAAKLAEQQRQRDERKKLVQQTASRYGSAPRSSSFSTSTLRATATGTQGSANKEEEQERVAIRERYFGKKAEKRKIRRMNEKKFVFDWEEKDDTSVDYNPLYKEVHEVQLFGRGHIAGIDVKTQKKEKGRFYEKVLSTRRTDEQQQQAERNMKRLERKHNRKLDERHWGDKPLEEMTPRDWRIFREDFNITTKGGKVPNPLRFWSEAGLDDRILKVLDEIGYTSPTPIQRCAVPIGLCNRDIIGIAETGSGKTLAFVFPLLQWILSLPKLVRLQDIDNGPYAIILAPTRDLAQQIQEETDLFAMPLGIRTVAIIGGLDKEAQGSAVARGREIVIATPGRLKDVLENRYLVLNQCSYVVFDEADRMLDMGFEPEVKEILSHIPATNLKPDSDEAEDADLLLSDMKNKMKLRQTVLFSATMPPKVETLARTYLRRPAIVNIGTIGRPTDSVQQTVVMCTEEQKKMELVKILQQSFVPPIIIFVNQKKGCNVLAKSLEKAGYSATTLHSGKGQDQRAQSLKEIKDGVKDILVATNVAGRGIDIKDVSLVINYDMAGSIEDYTHRIGRTGRGGSKGAAITFLTEDDSKVFYELKQMLRESKGSVYPSALDHHPAAQYKPGTVLDKYGKAVTL